MNKNQVPRQLYLQKEQDDYLKEYSAKTGIPIARILRRLVEKFILETQGKDTPGILTKDESGKYTV